MAEVGDFSTGLYSAVVVAEHMIKIKTVKDFG